MTRKETVKELARLVKPRTYLVRIWDVYGIKIDAEWTSGMDIDITTSNKIMIGKRKKKGVFTFDQLQVELSKFQQDIVQLCDASDRLAKQDGCKGEYQLYTYFEGLKR